MSRCYVGLSRLQGKLPRYAEQYDLLELRPVDTPLPPAPKLERWRGQVPPAFAFSIVLPRVVGQLTPGAEFDDALRRSLEAARVLQARAVILATPATVRPTQSNRRRLTDVARRLPEAGPLLGWQPAGMWELPDVFETAGNAGLLPVLDAVRDPLPPGPLAYTRVRILGGSAQLGGTSIARLAEQLQDRREAFVVIDGPSAGRVKAGLEALLGQPQRRALPSTLFRPQSGNGFAAEDEEQ